MFSPNLLILSVIFGLGTFSPTSTWTRQQQSQLNLLSWVEQQNQLYASGEILASSGGASPASSSLLSEWQTAYQEQLQLLAEVAVQHQQFINGQTSPEFEVEEMMVVQDAEEESVEGIPDEDSTEAVAYLSRSVFGGESWSFSKATTFVQKLLTRNLS